MARRGDAPGLTLIKTCGGKVPYIELALRRPAAATGRDAMYKRFLIATDGSELAEKAVTSGLALPKIWALRWWS